MPSSLILCVSVFKISCGKTDKKQRKTYIATSVGVHNKQLDITHQGAYLLPQCRYWRAAGVQMLTLTHNQSLINSSLVHNVPIPQILWKSTCNFLSYPPNKQTNRQTDIGQNITTPTSGGGKYSYQSILYSVQKKDSIVLSHGS